MSDDQNKEIIDGTCFWPLFPFGVARSDLMKFGVGGTSVDIGYCPFRYTNSLQSYATMCTNCDEIGKKDCCYSFKFYQNYHKYFLLSNIEKIKKPSDPIFFEKIKDEDNYIRVYDIYNSDTLIKKELLKSLDMFPQPFSINVTQFDDLNELGLSKILGKIQKIDELHFFEKYDPDDKIGGTDISAGKFFVKFYALCDGLQSNDENIEAANAFSKIVARDKVKKSLLHDDGNSTDHHIVFAVLASFYADKHIDAIMSIMLDRNKIAISGNHNEHEKQIKDYFEYIAQSFGTVLERLRLQRISYLNSWCCRLRQQVAATKQNKKQELESNKQKLQQRKQILQEKELIREKTLPILYEIVRLRLEIPELISYIEELKREIEENYYTKEFYESIRKMIVVLYAKPNVNVNASHNIEKCQGWNDKKQKWDNIENKFCIDGDSKSHLDRCKTICEFCNKAREYLKDGLRQTSKLKGTLSSDLVQELRAIAHSEPTKARLLIRGDGGSGKGAVAEDFHAFCMENIGKAICENEQLLMELQKGNFDELFKTLENPAKEFFEDIQKNLKNILELPPLGKRKIQIGHQDIWDLTKLQLTGTSWWHWEGQVKEDELKKEGLSDKEIDDIKELQSIICTCTLCLKEDKNNNKDIHKIFLLILVAKIAYEYKKKGKADWSFNFFQVNCGILGGQGAELAESLKRLFGTCGRSRAGKDAVPGLFQTCSYVGGTLFLDEIADAPIRIQDNLLRPLEEGKVSRPGWDSFDEKVKNIRIVGATFKNLEGLARLYRKTLADGDPKGFRPDLLTRLKRNVPVSCVPLWHHFMPHHKYDSHELRQDFCFVMSQFPDAVSKKLLERFWEQVYNHIKGRIERVCDRASGHLPDETDRYRHYASLINTRFLKALIERTPEDTHELDAELRKYLDRMLDFLLTEVGADDA